jgi:hypothetical protein
MTRQEIEQKMDELAREYFDNKDPEIPEKIFELARRLREMEHWRTIPKSGFADVHCCVGLRIFW